MTTPEKKTIRVWDVPVRLFHWTLATLFALSAYSAFQDKFGIYADMHFYSGYTILILVTWRILWGFFGSKTAQFKTFVKGPSAILKNIKQLFNYDEDHTVGHKALGAVSVMLVLLLLLMQASFGLFASDGMIFSGPLSDEVSSNLRGFFTRWHKDIGLVLLGLVLLHLLAIAYYGMFKGDDLVTPMITGKKRVASHVEEPTRKPAWRAALFFLLAGGLVCTLVFVL